MNGLRYAKFLSDGFAETKRTEIKASVAAKPSISEPKGNGLR